MIDVVRLATDPEFQEYVLASVQTYREGYQLNFENGWSLGVDKGPIHPEAGMTVRVYEKGVGYTVRGVVISGKPFYYRTPEQEKQHHAQSVANLKRERREHYERTKDEMQARLQTYPEVFRKRIERFLRNAPETAWEYQGYEMAVCDATLAIIDNCLDGEALHLWKAGKLKLPNLEEKLVSLELSGHQVDMARRLAYWWFADEADNIWKEHAAIAFLTGCQEAGCPPVDEEATA